MGTVLFVPLYIVLLSCSKHWDKKNRPHCPGNSFPEKKELYDKQRILSIELIKLHKKHDNEWML